MKLVFDLIGGKVLEPDLPSPPGGLGRGRRGGEAERDAECETNIVTPRSSLSSEVTRKETGH